jgi:ribosomal-protein-alanine N-acetyltransferase
MCTADIPLIAAIDVDSFDVPWSEASFTRELEENRLARYYCLDLDGATVGYMGLWLIVFEAHITNIALRREQRRQGLGEHLLRFVLADLERLGITDFTLEVRASNTAALALYSKVGFESSGIRPRYYVDNNEDAVIMWRRAVCSNKQLEPLN